MLGPVCPPENEASALASDPGAVREFMSGTRSAHRGSREETVGPPLLLPDVSSWENPDGMSATASNAFFSDAAVRSFDAEALAVALVGERNRPQRGMKARVARRRTERLPRPHDRVC
jgi:hypothetical protein